MKTQTFKADGHFIVRLTISDDEQDRAIVAWIAARGPGLCAAATNKNCHALLPSHAGDRTFQLSVPESAVQGQNLTLSAAQALDALKLCPSG